MPADGEFRFTELLGQFVASEYSKAKHSQCIRSAFANGFMVSVATYLAAYVATHNHTKSFYRFALPAYLVTAIATTAICDIQSNEKT